MSRNYSADPSGAWVRRYLTLLGVNGGPPCLDSLAEVTRAHVLTVPFENVTALLRRRAYPTGPVPAPDPDVLLDTWERRAGGGVCFEIAMMVNRLLTGLGYRTQLLLGQISVPNGHQAVLVEVGGRRYLIDLGNGAPLFEPIPLDTLPYEIHRYGLSFRYRVAEGTDEIIQDRVIDGAWKGYCRFSLQSAVDADREGGYQHHHTPNASWVTGSLTMVRSTFDSVYALKDATLTRYTADGKTIETLDGEADYLQVAREVYGLPGLRISEALAMRTALSRLGNQAAPS